MKEFWKPTDEEWEKMVPFEQVAYRADKLYHALKRIRDSFPLVFPPPDWNDRHETMLHWQFATHRDSLIEIADILEGLDI